MCDRWSARRSPAFILESKSLHMFTHDSLVDMLSEHVRKAFAAWNLRQFEIIFAQPVLDPQLSSGQVPDLLQSRRLAIPMAAVASVMIVSCSLMPRCAARDWWPRLWAAPLHITVFSASAELSATAV